MSLRVDGLDLATQTCCECGQGFDCGSALSAFLRHFKEGTALPRMRHDATLRDMLIGSGVYLSSYDGPMRGLGSGSVNSRTQFDTTTGDASRGEDPANTVVGDLREARRTGSLASSTTSQPPFMAPFLARAFVVRPDLRDRPWREVEDVYGKDCLCVFNPSRWVGEVSVGPPFCPFCEVPKREVPEKAGLKKEIWIWKLTGRNCPAGRQRAKRGPCSEAGLSRCRGLAEGVRGIDCYPNLYMRSGGRVHKFAEHYEQRLSKWRQKKDGRKIGEAE
ncbi:hypothetical protein JOM56_013602 [Amanita muscaria]